MSFSKFSGLLNLTRSAGDSNPLSRLGFSPHCAPAHLIFGVMLSTYESSVTCLTERHTRAIPRSVCSDIKSSEYVCGNTIYLICNAQPTLFAVLIKGLPQADPGSRLPCPGFQANHYAACEMTNAWATAAEFRA